jgi:dTDP-4-amino-4,6-dideoxygalactose transaminase
MSANNKVPFLDLVTQHLELEEELVSVFRSALKTAGFIGGPMVESFEREFAEFCETRHCVGVSSGTDALRFALTASGVKTGDTVLTVPNTFIATTEAISQAGARPDFVDVDEQTYTLSPAKLRAYLDTECSRDARTGRSVHKRTGSPVTAVVPVHLYGQIADMDAILGIAAEYQLVVVEDACQAHGAEYFSYKDRRWHKAGSMGKAAAFSMYPGKNLGACGEAGAITTNDEGVARQCQMLRDHGQSKKYYHDLEGYNGRLDAIQAGILRVKLGHLAKWNDERRRLAASYDGLLAAAEGTIVRPHVPAWSRPVHHLYVVRVQNRDAVQAALGAVGIGTGIHYPIPLHMTKAYAHFGFRQGAFPVTEEAAGEILSLPMFPGLTTEDQGRAVAELIKIAAEQENRAGRSTTTMSVTAASA